MPNPGEAMKGSEYTPIPDLSGVLKSRKKGPLHKDMSLRDYFAAQAMQALIAAPPVSPHTGPFDDEAISDFRRRVANGAYYYADAMIEARKS